MRNLFSSFDPNSRIMFLSFSYKWLSILGILFILPQKFWIIKNQIIEGLNLVIKLLIAELEAIFGRLIIPGTLIIFLRYFFVVLGCNFLGLLPYVFTASRHLVFTLALSLPLWLGSIVWSIIHQFNNIAAHLVPLGTPTGLIPIIVLIETIRSIIRPATLAVRLAANIIAGHLLLTLLGRQGRLSLRPSNLLLIALLMLLVTLEIAVACIQSYVFIVLRSLYLSELRRVEFTKSFI